MTRAVILALCLVLLGYGLFEARKLIEGPIITIESPANGSATSTTALVVTGTAQNIAFLTIDDRPAFTDESGRFSLTLSPPAGYTSITVAATDRFGRRTQQSIAINMLDYCPV
jgi:hypothetical protein